jgi:sRNA-binding protein
MIAMRWVLVALLAGCGPVAYVSQVTFDADNAVAAARASNAAKYSPYWWTRATQYLHMAREVAAHADFQGANHFGRLATEAAVNARAEAEQAAKAGPVPAKVDTGSDVAPAKDDAPVPAKDTP